MITRGVTIREGHSQYTEGGIWMGREEKQPTIAICHEFKTNMRFTSRYAQMLCNRGTPPFYI